MPKRTEKRSRPAQAEQKLPGPVPAPALAQPPAGSWSRSNSHHPVIETLGDWTEAPLWVGFVTQGTGPHGAAEAAADLAPTPPNARLVGPILHEAELMRRLRPDSLAVALRPDPQTEIMLRLTQRRGTIEAEASYERGDLESMLSAWPDLQRRLQPQGVQLLDLEWPAELASMKQTKTPANSPDNRSFSAPEVGYGGFEIHAPAPTSVFSPF
jgi:hypothetical protein